jgi:serralysin
MHRTSPLVAAPLVAAAFAAATLTGLRPAAAATYYVAPTGDDTKNTGTSLASPWLTIQHAVDQAQPGDAIEVRDGLYAEAVHFTRSGASGAPIALRSHPGEHPIIEASGGFPVLIEAEPWQNRIEIGWITVDGFELRAGTVGVEITNAHDVSVTRCFIHDNTVQGILGAGHDVVVDRNVIAYNGDASGGNNHDHGMYLTGRRFRITNNLVRANAAYGLQVAAYGCYATSGECAGTDYSGAVDWLIANNTFALQQNRSGIVLWLPDPSYGTPLGDIGNLTVDNNVFYDNSLANPGTVSGVEFVGWTGDSTVVIDHNLYFSQNGGADVDNAGGSVVVKGAIDADPGFVDAGALDFHLAAGSAAVDVGLTIAEVPVDLDGVHRPQGAAFDLGAYERCAGPCTDGPDGGGDAGADAGADAAAQAGDGAAAADASVDARGATQPDGGPLDLDAGSGAAASGGSGGASGGCACRASVTGRDDDVAAATAAGVLGLALVLAVRRRRAG